MVCGDAVEPGFDVGAGDGVERASQPVAQVAVGLVAVEIIRALGAVGVGRHVVLECISKGRRAARFGAFFRRVAAARDLAEGRLRHPSCLVGSNLPVAAKHDALVGGLPAALSGTVVDDEGLGARRVDSDAEAGELVVPGDPRLVSWLEGFDGALGQRCTHLRGAFSCTHLHRGRMAAVDERVNTTVNTEKENAVAGSRGAAMGTAKNFL